MATKTSIWLSYVEKYASHNYTTLTLTTLATPPPRPHQASSRRPPHPLRQDTCLSAREVVVPAKERISIN